MAVSLAMMLTLAPRASLADELPALKAPYAVLVTANGGQTLYSRDASARRAPASMTKLMTLHLALQAIARHRAKPSDLVSVSENAYRLGGSQIWLEPGESLQLGQLLRAIAVGSANDACVAVAEHLAGSEGAFVTQMNREARRLGMKNTHYANSHGLDDPNHYTSPADMAILARVAVRDPGLLNLTSMREDRTIRNGKGGRLWIVNHNRLIGKFAGLDGLKTGFTDSAGYCLTATAQREGLRLIAVVMGDRTSKERFSDAAMLLQHGFGQYQAVHLARRGQSLGRVQVMRGETPSVSAVVAADVTAVRRRSESGKVTLRPKLPQKVNAPISRGTPIGRAEIRVGSRPVGEVQLVAAACVRKVTVTSLFKGLVWQLVRV